MATCSQGLFLKNVEGPKPPALVLPQLKGFALYESREHENTKNVLEKIPYVIVKSLFVVGPSTGAVISQVGSVPAIPHSCEINFTAYLMKPFTERKKCQISYVSQNCEL